MIDLPIPGNDDSMRSIELVIHRLTEAILEGKAAAPVEAAPPAEAGPGRGDRDRDRRRGPARGGDGQRGPVRPREPEPQASMTAPQAPAQPEPQPESQPAGLTAGGESLPVPDGEPVPAEAP
jgi:small subunit ribosomal protein S2